MILSNFVQTTGLMQSNHSILANTQPSTYFFIGLGGMGMAPLAMYMRGAGATVYGSDDALTPGVGTLLQRYGIHRVSMIPQDVQEVIYSSAIPVSHPCYQQALEHKLLLTPRGVFLSRLAANKKLIAIVGSHGKSTTAAMLAHTLVSSHCDVGFILGAITREGLCPSALWSASDWLVAEIDESDGTINNFCPEITVALNLDWDHPGYYAHEAKLDETFKALFARTHKAVLIPDGQVRLEHLVQGLEAKVLRFGQHGDFCGDITHTDTRSCILKLGGLYPFKSIKVPAAGYFNACNALAALAAAVVAEFKIKEEPLINFLGVGRRQDYLYQSSSLTVLADYAHHPEELQALITSLRKDYPSHQLIGVFQPHRYTRTRQYAQDFARVLERLDIGYLLPVYAASETFMLEGTSEAIAAWLGTHSCVYTWLNKNVDTLWAELDTHLAQGPSVLVFMGAGDVDLMAYAWKRRKSDMLLQAQELFSLERIRPFLGQTTYLSQAEPLAVKTTLRVGGPARWYAEPASVQDLRMLLAYARASQIKIFILGRGSNILVADEGFDGLVIRLNHGAWQQISRLGPYHIWAAAGVRLKELCGFAGKQGLSGFEFMEGIPGVVGGAVRMNAGAMGWAFMDRVVQVEWLGYDGQLHSCSPAHLNVAYRSTQGVAQGVVLGVVLQAEALQLPQYIKECTQVLSLKRKSSQPRESSAGCVFKNPPCGASGQLIEHAGLKGLCIGNAQVSTIHGNFIVNLGQAKAQDVLDLIKHMHTNILAQTGIALEPEVQLLGKTWKEIF